MAEGDVSDQLWTHWNISVMLIGAVFSVIFLAMLVYHVVFKRTSKAKEIRKLLIYAAMCHIVAWIIHFIASMTTYLKTSNHRHDAHDAANYTICAMIMLHPIFFYTLMIGRIFYAFKVSIYALKPMEFIPIAIGVCVAVIARFLEQASWILVIHGNPPILPVENLLNCLWVFISFDVATRLFLVYLFVRKLFLVVMKQTDDVLSRSTSSISRCATPGSRSKSVSNGHGAVPPITCDLATEHGQEMDGARHGEGEKKKESVVLNMIQIQYLSVIKQIALLGVCSSLPQAIARVVFVVDFIAVDGVFTHRNWIAYNTLQSLAVFLELLSIVLSFSFNHALYYMCCKYCDQGCAQCWKRGTKRKITVSRQQSAQQESSISPVDAPSTVQMSKSASRGNVL